MIYRQHCLRRLKSWPFVTAGGVKESQENSALVAFGMDKTVRWSHEKHESFFTRRASYNGVLLGEHVIIAYESRILISDERKSPRDIGSGWRNCEFSP